MGGDSERALADGCCCGELERDLLLDLDLDLASPLPFSLGDRDLDLDLDRDFSDFSLDLLCERDPLSDLGLDLLFDLDFLLLDRERERSLLRDLDLDLSKSERKSLFCMACSALPAAVTICQQGSPCTGSVDSEALTGNGFWRHYGICCGCSDSSDFCF